MNTVSIEDEISQMVARVSIGVIGYRGDCVAKDVTIHRANALPVPKKKWSRKIAHRLNMRKYRKADPEHYRQQNLKHVRAFRARQKKQGN